MPILNYDVEEEEEVVMPELQVNNNQGIDTSSQHSVAISQVLSNLIHQGAKTIKDGVVNIYMTSVQGNLQVTTSNNQDQQQMSGWTGVLKTMTSFLYALTWAKAVLILLVILGLVMSKVPRGDAAENISVDFNDIMDAKFDPANPKASWEKLLKVTSQLSKEKANLEKENALTKDSIFLTTTQFYAGSALLAAAAGVGAMAATGNLGPALSFVKDALIRGGSTQRVLQPSLGDILAAAPLHR